MGFFDWNFNYSFGLNNWFMPVLPFQTLQSLSSFKLPSIFPAPNSYSEWTFPVLDWKNFQFQLPIFNYYPQSYQWNVYQTQYSKPEIELKNPFEEKQKADITSSKKPEIEPIQTKKTDSKQRKTKKKIKYTKQGNVDHRYLQWSQKEAEKHAKNDPNLERLNGGKNWSVANTFYTDIPYAKKGTGKILDKVAAILGEKLVITSALGTGEPGTPHIIGNGYKSHHNAENPKLDIRTNGNANEFAKRLRSTGYFSHILAEGDHVDVQINPDKFRELNIEA